MPVNLNAYKTIFLKPDSEGRSVNVNNNNAMAFIFKPIDNTMEELRVLFNTSAQSDTVLPPITYYMSICEVDQSTLIPLISNIDTSTLENQIAYSYTKTNTSVNGKSWITFKNRAVFSSITDSLDINKFYAIVIKSDAPSVGTTYSNNGPVYTEIPYHYNDNLTTSFSFNGTTWVEKKFNSSNIFANILFYGGIIDEINEIDLGSTSTSGLSSNRGYEVFLTIKNLEGSTKAENLTFLPNLTKNNGVSKEETYLAAGNWLRFKPEFLPFDTVDFESNLYSTEIGTTLDGGNLVLFCQRDRIYPYPKSFINTKTSHNEINNDSVVDNTKLLNIINPIPTIYYNNSGSDISVQKKSSSEFKKFIIKNYLYFKDSNNNVIESGASSRAIGKYINRVASDKTSSSGYKIVSHTDPSTIEIESNLKYPENKNSTDINNQDRAKIERIDAASFVNYFSGIINNSSLYSGFTMPFFLGNQPSRFYDNSKTSTTGELSNYRLFALNNNDFVLGGSYLDAPSNRIPYLIGSNTLNESSKKGGVIDSLGFNIHTGRSNINFESIVVPEYYDLETLNASGLTDYNENLDIGNSTGLLLTHHYMCTRENKVRVNALIVNNITSNAISTFGQCFSCGTFTQCTDNGGTTIDVKISNYKFTPVERAYLITSNFRLIPQPFKNSKLYKRNMDCGFKIIYVNDDIITIQGNISDFIDTGAIEETSGELPTSVIEKSFYLAFFGDAPLTEYGVDGKAVGIHKFDSPPDSDFFASFSQLTNYDNNYYSYGSPVGLFMGKSNEIDALSNNTEWIGETFNFNGVDSFEYYDTTKRNKVFILEVTPEVLNNEEKTFYNEHNLKHILDFIVNSGNDNGDYGRFAVCTIQDSDVLDSSDFYSDVNDFAEVFTNLWNSIVDGTYVVSGTVEPTNYFKSLYEVGRRCPEDGYHLYLFGSDDSQYSLDNTNLSKLNLMVTHNNGRYPTSYGGNTNPFGTNDNLDAGKLFDYSGGSIIPVDPSLNLIYSYHYCKPIRIYPSNTPEKNLSSFEKIAKLQGQTLHYTKAMEYETTSNPNVPSLDHYEGFVTYNKTNGNLLDILETLNSYKSFYSNPLSTVPSLKEYSLIVPFTHANHGDSLNEFLTNNPSFAANTDILTIDTTLNNIYEVYDHPYGAWSDSNTVLNSKTNKKENKNNEFYIYDYSYEPFNSSNSNNYESPDNYTSFNLVNYNEFNTNYLNNKDTLSLDLGSNAKYTNITFAYRINYPEYSDNSENTKVNLIIQSSNDKYFYLSNKNTLTLFDGILDKDSSIELTTFNNITLNTNSFILPDNFILFSLDLSNVIDSESGRYLKIHFAKNNNSIATEVNLSNLRIYKKDNSDKSFYGFGYGNQTIDYFNVFGINGDGRGYFDTVGSSVPDMTGYNYGYGYEFLYSDFMIPSIFGSINSPENVIDDSVYAEFKNSNDYVVIDLGKEIPVTNISFDVYAPNNTSNSYSVYYKTFNYNNSGNNKYIISDAIIDEKVDINNRYTENIKCNIFARLIVIKANGVGSFNINNFKAKIGSMLDIYSDPPISTYKEYLLEASLSNPEYDELGTIWSPSGTKSTVPGLIEPNSRFTTLAILGKKCRFSPAALANGSNIYRILYTAPNAPSNDSPTTTVRVNTANGIEEFLMDFNQTNSGDKWLEIGEFVLDSANSPYVEFDTTTSNNGVVDANIRFYADALKFEFVASLSAGIDEALNHEYSIYDEDIRTAPNKRVAKMTEKNNFLGIKLSDSDPVDVTQISFSIYPEDNIYNSEIGTNTYFEVQKTTKSITPIGISPLDAAWETISTAAVGRYYDRLPQNSKSFFTLQNTGIGIDGLFLIIDDPIIVSRAANNGFVDNGPYVLRINNRNDLVFYILESYSDGQKAYIKLNANIRQIGIQNNTEFYIERPTIISFPSTKATGLQIIKKTGASVKLNSLKVYTNLIDKDGNVIPPSSGDLKWFMKLESN